jgi:hypothetical protein
MKRDPRLHGLSAEHHHALVLARRVADACAAGQAAGLAAELRARFDAELAPHFATEEELLLPALREAGLEALAARTATEHDELRAHLAAAERGDTGRLAAFAAALTDHVRFEERELFPGCEARLPGAVLDALAARAPKRR